ncbi:MAG: alpha/beta fold hydrolase [Gammaproteobacteria bacterium]
MAPQSGFANVNGTSLYYELSGSGPTVVLIHGFSIDTRMWDEQMDGLTSRYQVLRYDMRGFGRSSLPDEKPYDPCVDLLELLNHLKLDKVSLVGLSLGGWVATDFTIANPDKVNVLVVADTALMGYEWQEGRPSTLPVEVAQSKGIEAAKQFWLASPLFEAARRHPRVLRHLGEMVDDYSGWHWIHENPQILADEPTIYALKDIRCPTLVLVGEHDTFDFQRIAEILEEQIRNARRVVIKDAGHMSNMENPQQFNAEMKRFLDENL